MNLNYPDTHAYNESMIINVSYWAMKLSRELATHITAPPDGWYLSNKLYPSLTQDNDYVYSNDVTVDITDPYKIHDCIYDNTATLKVHKHHLDNHLLSLTPTVPIHELFIIEDVINNYILENNPYKNLLPNHKQRINYLPMFFTESSVVTGVIYEDLIEDMLFDLLGQIESFIISKPEYIYTVSITASGDLTIGRGMDVRAYAYIVKSIDDAHFKQMYSYE